MLSSWTLHSCSVLFYLSESPKMCFRLILPKEKQVCLIAAVDKVVLRWKKKKNYNFNFEESGFWNDERQHTEEFILSLRSPLWLYFVLLAFSIFHEWSVQLIWKRPPLLKESLQERQLQAAQYWFYVVQHRWIRVLLQLLLERVEEKQLWKDDINLWSDVRVFN